MALKDVVFGGEMGYAYSIFNVISKDSNGGAYR